MRISVRIAPFAAALALSAPTALAQSAPQTKTVVSSTTLENGLQVIVIRNPTIPIVNLQMVFRGGAATQITEQLQGVPHLLEHVLFRPEDDDGGFRRQASDIDASWNGATSAESVRYYLTFPTKHFEKGMEILAELIRKPDLNNQKFVDSEKKVVRGELERRAAEPTGLLRVESDMLLWEGPGWGAKNPGGNMIAVHAATPSMLNTLYKKYYVPNNAALIVAGDVKDSVVFELARKNYRAWRRGADPLADIPPPNIPALTTIKRKFMTQDVQTVTILARWHGPSTLKDRSATYAADVFSGLVNQDLSGTQKRLVDAGIVDDVYLSYTTLNHIGPIELQARTSPDRAVAAIEALGDELQKLTQPDYYSDADLRLAKKRQQVEAHYRFESASSAAEVLADFWSSADLDYFVGYSDSLETQNRATIQRFVDTYIKGKPMVVVTLVPFEAWRTHSSPLQRAVARWKAP
jgi:zinc protease